MGEAGNFQRLQASIDAVLATCCSTRKRETIEKRINDLYEKLQAGKIDAPVQAELLGFAEAISSNDQVGAGMRVASISAENWNLHKEWIIGLKQLLSCQ